MSTKRTETLLELERRLWKGDAEQFRALLADGALMAFPDPIGVLERDATIEAVEQAPRWQSVEFHDVRTVALGASAAVLSYRAVARRSPDEPSYTVRAGSCYVRSDDGWRLAYHHQTPL